MSEVTHNLEQCLGQIDAEARRVEEETLKGTKAAAIHGLRLLLFELIPVKTGLTAATTDLQVNGISSLRITRTKARIAVGKRNQMVPLRQQRLKEADTRLKAVKRLADVERITIANNAALATKLVDGRVVSKKRPGNFMDVARQRIAADLDALQARVK